MKALFALIGSLVVSLAIYCVGYWTVLDFPTRFFFLDRLVNAKIEQLRDARDEPKFVVFAGSNGHFSHSCKLIAAAIDRRCINAGTTIEYDMSYLGRELRATLRPGDIVYMPVEYEFFEVYHSSWRVGREALGIVIRERFKLADLPFRERMSALFHLDFLWATRSLFDRLYWRLRMRKEAALMPPFKDSDAVIVTPAEAQLHAWWRRIQPSVVGRLDAIDFEGASYAQRLGDFLDWCRGRGVTVIGGLPAVYDDAPVPNSIVARVRNQFTSHGQSFVVLDNRSQYPRALFYDKEYHLADAGRTRHTVLLIRKLLESGLVKPRR